VTTLAFHPDGRFLATGCLDQQARLFAVPGDAGSPLWPPVRHCQEAGTAWYREFNSAPLFVNGGRELLTYGGKNAGLTWRALETGAVARTQSLTDWDGVIASAALSPDGRYFAVSRVQLPAFRLIEASTGRLVEPAIDNQGSVTGMAFSADSRMLATSSSRSTVRLWSVPAGKPWPRRSTFTAPSTSSRSSPGGGRSPRRTLAWSASGGYPKRG